MNLQATSSIDIGADTLAVVHIWHTIQGEGPHAGRPAVFVRLGGCNLRCPQCDTLYNNSRFWATTRIVDQVLALGGPKTRFVVLTGGEPFRQDLGLLTRELLTRDWHVQVETNGTLPPRCDEQTEIVTSPKTPRINEEILRQAAAFKYVVEDGYIDEEGFPTRVLGTDMKVARPRPTIERRRIYIQPLDSQDPVANKANTNAAVDTALKFGYTLCLQVHKIVGLS